MAVIESFWLSVWRQLQTSTLLLVAVLILILPGAGFSQDGGRIYTGNPKNNPPANATPKPAPKPVKKPTTDRPPEPTPAKPGGKVQTPMLVRIPGGSFIMGASGHRANEAPTHNVELESFEIGIYEVTNQEFEAFVNATNYQTQAELEHNPITWRSYYQPERANYPVVLVTWYDASKYCKWLSEATGEHFRLPTEAEWEYAARGGSDKDYPWGDEIDTDHANFDSEGDRSLFTGVALDLIVPVDSFSANGFGLYNVSGNVWEWCQDWYDEHYYQNAASRNPTGPEMGTFKVMRGGSWVNDANACRLSYRNYNTITFKMPYLGFRVVKSPH